MNALQANIIINSTPAFKVASLLGLQPIFNN